MTETVYHQRGFTARFEWGRDGVQQLAPHSDLIVIIDVLSFTTCVNVAVAQGATVFPYRYQDETAKTYAEQKNALLAGKRGADLSLSPVSLQKLTLGSRVVLPSPNGSTCTILAAQAGAKVVAGSLRNAAAVAEYAKQQGGVVSVIACGELWEMATLRPALEDLVGAGAILSYFAEEDLSPEAKMAVAAFQAAKGQLLPLLQECSSGRELIEKGYSEDVVLASEWNVSHIVPVLAEKENAYVAWKGGTVRDDLDLSVGSKSNA